MAQCIYAFLDHLLLLTKCSYNISLLSVVGKIYAGILVGRVTEGLIDDDQGSFRAGRGCVDQIFILKQIGEKKCNVCGFYRFGGSIQ